MPYDEMNPLSGEHVEVDGTYTNEWGREEKFKRGDVFPADPQLGTTAWKLINLDCEPERRDTPFDEHNGNEDGPESTETSF